MSVSNWYKVNTTKLQIRQGPGTNYTDVGDLFMGDMIEVTETLGGWHRVISVLRVSAPTIIENMAENSWCSAAYTVQIPDPDDELVPQPEPPAVKPLTITIGGDTYETITVTLNPKV